MDIKIRFQSHLETGFPDWSLNDYQELIKAFRKYYPNELDLIYNGVRSKEPEQV